MLPCQCLEILPSGTGIFADDRAASKLDIFHHICNAAAVSSIFNQLYRETSSSTGTLTVPGPNLSYPTFSVISEARDRSVPEVVDMVDNHTNSPHFAFLINHEI